MLKATFQFHYISKNGTPTDSYTVTGTAEELQAYEAAMGSFFKIDEKTQSPIYWRSRTAPDGSRKMLKQSLTLLITANNKVVEDTSKEDLALSNAVQANLAKAIAEAQAQAYLPQNQRQQRAQVTIVETPNQLANAKGAPVVTAQNALDNAINNIDNANAGEPAADEGVGE